MKETRMRLAREVYGNKEHPKYNPNHPYVKEMEEEERDAPLYEKEKKKKK